MNRKGAYGAGGAPFCGAPQSLLRVGGKTAVYVERLALLTPYAGFTVL
jgi:hypothetical protein